LGKLEKAQHVRIGQKRRSKPAQYASGKGPWLGRFGLIADYAQAA
jgi:hypothetical protein